MTILPEKRPIGVSQKQIRNKKRGFILKAVVRQTGYSLTWGDIRFQYVKGRNSQTLHYNVEGITEVSWEIVPQNGEHVGKFRATAGGRKYGHTSDPFPDYIKGLMDNVSKKQTKKDFQVTVKSNNPDIRGYFRC